MRLKAAASLGRGAVCLIVAGLAVGLVIGRAYIRGAYRHVTVRVFNVDSSERVFVNCEQAAELQPGDNERTVDLGWLDPADRVTMTATSGRGDVAWGFHAISDGEELFLHQRGQANVDGFAADPYVVVMAKTFTAGRDRLGTVGCEKRGTVDPALVGYHMSPDELDAPLAAEGESPFQRKRPELEAVYVWGGRAPLIAGILGIVAVFLTARLRGFVVRHARRLNPVEAGASLIGLVSSLFGLWHYLGSSRFLDLFALIGILLLVLSAVTLAAPVLCRLLHEPVEAMDTGEARAESPHP
jgi:hypothetical protein